MKRLDPDRDFLILEILFYQVYNGIILLLNGIGGDYGRVQRRYLDIDSSGS